MDLKPISDMYDSSGKLILFLIASGQEMDSEVESISKPVLPSIDGIIGLFWDKLNEIHSLLEQDRKQTLLPNDLGLELLKPYSIQEVAAFLGSDAETVRRIPAEVLPTVKRIGNRKGILGINILCYMHELLPVNYEDIAVNQRERILYEGSKVDSMSAAPHKQGIC